jgi:hypothetical protein
MIYPGTNRHRSVGARVVMGRGEGLYGRPLPVVSSTSVGARVEMGGGEGLYGRPWGGAYTGRCFERTFDGCRGRGRWERRLGPLRVPCVPSRLARPFLLLRLLLLMLFLTIIFTSCSSGNQHAQQPDPRLKSFHIMSARIIMLDSQAEVDGTVQNLGHDAFPFDVTILATFYDSAGHAIGQAQGAAEDVFPGMVRSFVLMGQVNSLRYSYMKLSPVSLRERRYEPNLPTPTPVVP